MITRATEKTPLSRNWRVYGLNTLLLFGLVASRPCRAQTAYYVATDGNDANAGTSMTAPIKTLEKVNALPLQPGDQVLFRRGDTFRGTLLVRRSGAVGRSIVFDGYGSGPKPVLSGSVPVTNWSSVGGNVWQAACPACGDAVTGVYRGGNALPLGRYPNADAPNKGYLTIRAHTEKYQIFSQEPLPYGIDWKGGEVVMRPTQWIIDRAVIDAQYGDALNLFNYSNYYPGDGWGYFIQSHPATLDQDGEWYYNAANKTILLFSRVDPAGQFITATAYGRGVDLANVSNITVQNLAITETRNEGVFGTDISSFSLVNNDITHSGEDGLIIKGNGNSLYIENNKLIDVNNNGVYFSEYQHVVYRGNILRRVGVFPGRGKSGDGQYNGIQSNANQDVMVENNVVDSVGYNGISFWNNTTIRQNVISNYCMTKSDGGGLYAYNFSKNSMYGIYILSNIIYNGIGAPEGSYRREYSGANGIFLDDCVENVVIRKNTIFNNKQWGMYFHATNHVTFTDNTSYNNDACQIDAYHDAGYCPIRDNTIVRNIAVAKTHTQLVAQYESNADDLLQYGRIDSNYYARPFDDNATIRGIINWGQGGNYSLPEWQLFSKGQDLHSSASPILYDQYKTESAGGTTRFATSFDAGTDGWQVVYSPYNNAEATFDNTNKLDGGSLRVSFPTPSGQPNAYAQVAKTVGAVVKGKTYVLRFDAVSTVNVSIQVYLRQYSGPYQDLDRRYPITLSPARQSFELRFTASQSENNPIVMVQTDTEGPVFWLDNMRLQEDLPIANNPDDFIRLFYNPTLRDSTVTLPAGLHRDVKNVVYTNSVVLKPFTSLILFQDVMPAPPADLSLALVSDKRAVKLNESVQVRLRVRNESSTPAALARWTCRLPANLEVVPDNGQTYTDNVLTGTVSSLAAMTDTVFTFAVRPTAAGVFRVAAQLTTALSPDPDSSPNSGMADGEDDAAVTDFRVGDAASSVFSSPNPNQRVLPGVASNQPAADPTKADLSLTMAFSNRVPMLGEVITCTIYVDNAGGLAADGVQLQNLLPDGFDLVNSPNWTANGRTLTTTLGSVQAGARVSTSFQVRVNSAGAWINRAQVSACSTADSDSTPGNGFANGEDDQAQADVRVR